MKMHELLQEESSPIDVEEVGENEFRISTKDKAGPSRIALNDLYYTLRMRVKSATFLSSTGRAIGKTPPSVLIAKFSRGDGRKAVDDGIARVMKSQESRAKTIAYNKSPEKKKADAKFNAELRKNKKEEDDKTYGKGTLARIKYKQEGGDDGYQYVVRLDGRVVDRGLTLRQAQYTKERIAREIATKEKADDLAKKIRDDDLE